MKQIEKYPMIMIVIGVMGVSVSSIFVRFSAAPSAVTAAVRLIWTVLLMTPVVFGKREIRRELLRVDKRTLFMSILSGIFLAAHFTLWFESLQHTSVASTTSIGCTEVIWVSLGYCLFMKGKVSGKAVIAIAVAFAGSVLIAWSDSGAGGSHLYGDALALLASLAASVYMLIGRSVRSNASNTVYTYLVYVGCGAALLVLCAVRGYGLFSYGYSAILVGLGLAVCCTIMGHSVFSWCLKYFSPSFISASKLCEPVVATILAIFLFSEVPTAAKVIGGVLILSGVYMYGRLEAKTE